MAGGRLVFEVMGEDGCEVVSTLRLDSETMRGVGLLVASLTLALHSGRITTETAINLSADLLGISQPQIEAVSTDDEMMALVWRGVVAAFNDTGGQRVQ